MASGARAPPQQPQARRAARPRRGQLCPLGMCIHHGCCCMRPDGSADPTYTACGRCAQEPAGAAHRSWQMLRASARGRPTTAPPAGGRGGRRLQQQDAPTTAAACGASGRLLLNASQVKSTNNRLGAAARARSPVEPAPPRPPHTNRRRQAHRKKQRASGRVAEPGRAPAAAAGRTHGSKAPCAQPAAASHTTPIQSQPPRAAARARSRAGSVP